jgi:uncharacterized protein (TIGR02145 family)
MKHFFKIMLLMAAATAFAQANASGSSFTDTRDGKTYKTVKIGKQTWMAENLNHDVNGSKCYDNKPANCAKYGRLYNWATAMLLSASCNTSECKSKIQPKHKGFCPQGWHIPSVEESNQLFIFVDSDKGTKNKDYEPGDRYYSETAGKYLMAKESWKDYEGKSGNGTDDYGFTFLPSGIYGLDGSEKKFVGLGEVGGWWISAENGDDGGYLGIMSAMNVGVDNKQEKDILLGVRCVQD